MGFLFVPEGRGRVPSPSPPSRARSAQAAGGGTAAAGKEEKGSTKGINKIKRDQQKDQQKDQKGPPTNTVGIEYKAISPVKIQGQILLLYF